MAFVVHSDTMARQVADNIRKNWRTGDVSFTVRHSDFAFVVGNGDMWRELVRQWKSLGAVYDPHNTKQITINGKRFYILIIQPPDMNVTISPLAIGFNMVVSGYAYITPYKWAVELVATELKDNTYTPKTDDDDNDDE